MKIGTYNKYYQTLFAEEKIKQTFFIKTPKNIKLNISEKITSRNIYEIIKIFSKKSYKDSFLDKKNRFFKGFSFYTSVKDALKSPYNSKFIQRLFHCHFIFFKGEKKYIYSYNYPSRFLEEKNNKYISLKKDEVPKEFSRIVNKYFSNSNFIKKFFLFYLSLYILIFNKIIKIIFKFKF